MKRRDFLKTGLTAGVALNALPLMVGNSPVRALGRSPLRGMLETLDTNNNNVLVIVQLAGGNDGLNTLVPYGDTNYKTLRSQTLKLDLANDNLIKLAGHDTLAWHTAMKGMSQLWDDGTQKRMAIIQNIGYANPNLSHFRGTDIWNTATDSNLYAATGWLGRWMLDANMQSVIQEGAWPLAIQFGSNLSNAFLAQTGGMGIALSQFPTQSSPTGHHYDPIPNSPSTQYQELDYVQTIQRETETYANTIYKKVVVPNVANRATYPKTNLATDLSNVARLIVTQLNDNSTTTRTKVFLVTQPGYDTHSSQLTSQAKLLGDLSDALLAFQRDIEAMGVADNVAVMTYSEFGRRPQENGSGSDHGTAAPHFIISTKVKPQILGRDPDMSNDPKTGLVGGNLTYEYDFRSVYATVLNEWLLAGGSSNSTMIDKVLKTDDFGTYSNNLQWKSLGIFQPPPPQDVASNSDAPGLMLMQNYPNPASKITTFEYALPATGAVVLSIYDSRGVEIERVVDAKQEYGVQRASFDVSRLPAGPYLYRLQTAQGEVAQQMMVVH